MRRVRGLITPIALGIVVASAVVLYAYAFYRFVPLPLENGDEPEVQTRECGHLPRYIRPARRKARVGAYYFGGWSGPISDFRYRDLLERRFQGRQPLFGWRDAGADALEDQLLWARSYGVDFFAFLWYHNASDSRDPYLNQRLYEYVRLGDRRGIRFAIVYVNTDVDDDFVVSGQEWDRVIARWTSFFGDRSYVRVDGKPLLIVLDAFRMQRQLGGTRGLNRILGRIRTAAYRRGLPGVFVAGGIYVDQRFDWENFGAAVAGQDWDAFTQYAYPAVAGVRSGPRPYGELARAAVRMWTRFAEASNRPYIPVVMAGWDPRPWNAKVDGSLWWFDRTPSEFGSLVQHAIDWSVRRPPMRVAPKPFVLLEAWNELGEGSYIVPTIGTCHAYGYALSRALRGAATRGRRNKVRSP